MDTEPFANRPDVHFADNRRTYNAFNAKNFNCRSNSANKSYDGNFPAVHGVYQFEFTGGLSAVLDNAKCSANNSTDNSLQIDGCKFKGGCLNGDDN